MPYLLHIYCRCCSVVGGEFLGQNVEIYISDDVDGDNQGTLCAYGPTSDPQSEYIIHCFSGAMLGQVVTIRNRFTGSLKLCDVQVLGEFFYDVSNVWCLSSDHSCFRSILISDWVYVLIRDEINTSSEPFSDAERPFEPSLKNYMCCSRFSERFN